MKKRFFNFIKSHKGSHAVEAIFIVPVWLMLILYCGYVNLISSARQTLADETSAIVNILTLSESETKGRENVLDYIKVNKLESEFDTSGGTTSFLKITDTNGSPVSDLKWKDDTKILVSVKINTAFTGINFDKITIFDLEIRVFTDSYTNNCLAVIHNGK